MTRVNGLIAQGQPCPSGQDSIGATNSTRKATKDASRGRRALRLADQSNNASTQALTAPISTSPMSQYPGGKHPTPPTGTGERGSVDGARVDEKMKELSGKGQAENEEHLLRQQQLWREVREEQGGVRGHD